MHLILTGATGTVGSAVLTHVLSQPSITRVTILSRSPVAAADGAEKAQVIIHKDFTTYGSDVLEKLKGAEGVVWAQGIGSGEVDAKEYVKITHDYPIEAAKAFATLSDRFNFVYVSGEGATTKPSRFTPLFGRVKGQTEAELVDLMRTYPSLRVYNLRPGGVDPGNVKDPRPRPLMIKVSRVVLMPMLKALYPSAISPTKELSKVLVDLACGNGLPLEGKGIEAGGRTITNVGFRRLAGL